MPAGQFKARCLEIMDEVAATGEPVIVTKRGKAVAQLAPIARKPRTLRGFLKGRVRTLGDITKPIKVRWNTARS